MIRIQNKEMLATALNELCEVDHLTMFEAAVQLAEELDLEMEDFVTLLDKPTIQRIQQSAIEMNLLRPSFVASVRTSEDVEGFFQ